MNITVQQIMSKHLFFVKPNITVLEAAITMAEKKVGSLLIKKVAKVAKVVAIITEVDIVRKVVALGKDPRNTKVSDIMVSHIISISPDKTVLEANDLMDKNNIRHLVVEDDAKIVGIITSRDLQHPLFIEG